MQFQTQRFFPSCRANHDLRGYTREAWTKSGCLAKQNTQIPLLFRWSEFALTYSGATRNSRLSSRPALILGMVCSCFFHTRIYIDMFMRSADHRCFDSFSLSVCLFPFPFAKSMVQLPSFLNVPMSLFRLIHPDVLVVASSVLRCCMF